MDNVVDLFDPKVLVLYSALLTWVVQWMGRVPRLSNVLEQTWGKQLVAGVVGVGLAFIRDLNVLGDDADKGGIVLTGLMMAAAGGAVWAKIFGAISAAEDKIKEDDGY